jgi:hypothetical protein
MEEDEKPKEKEKEPRVILRSIRDAFVNFFIASARLVFFWLPGDDVTYGKALMIFHPLFVLAFTFFYFVVPQGHPVRILIILTGLMVVGSQWLLGGCVITRAEQKLTGEQVTILDPFLALAKIEVNRETRNAATVSMSTGVLVILIWCLVCDSILHRKEGPPLWPK